MLPEAMLANTLHVTRPGVVRLLLEHRITTRNRFSVPPGGVLLDRSGEQLIDGIHGRLEKTGAKSDKEAHLPRPTQVSRRKASVLPRN
ncbi:hypothetical protein JCM17961_33080 [Endothiovibrio diazotrophicus]